jgi:hypothetical protein
MKPLTSRTGVAALAVLAGCAYEARDIDPFPVAIDLSSGAAMAFASPAGGEPTPVTVDTLSPITILDSFRPGGDIPPPTRRAALDLTLYSAPAAGPPIPRLTLTGATVLDIHPCGGAESPTDCLVGLGDQTAVSRGVVGSDLLARAAVRFDFPSSEMRFFPGTAGTDADRGELCEAVFSRPFGGGGTLIVADGEVDYLGRRPALGACLDIDSDDSVLVERGVDALLVVATGLGVSVLSQDAYDRYATAFGAPPASALPPVTVHLPSGPTAAVLGEVGQIALTGEIGEDSERRGPCGELYASRVLAFDHCSTGAVGRCPCPDDNEFCRAGAALILKDPIQVAVVPDDHPLLQALRVELRPQFPELDGLLGATALSASRIELDYPNNRIIARCSDPTRCQARPQIRVRSGLPEVQACLP